MTLSVFYLEVYLFSLDMSNLCYYVRGEVCSMPDRAGIRENFPGAWKTCVKHVSSGPHNMAQALHATITSTFGMVAGTKVLKPLSEQLMALSQSSQSEREKCYLQLPPGKQNNRACQAALRAAYQTVVERSGTVNINPDSIVERFVENVLVEWSDMQCLSILEVRGLDPYFGGKREEARAFMEDTKSQLRDLLEGTVEEVVNSLENPQVSRVKMPRKAKRLEEDVLQDVVPVKVDLS